MIEHRNGKFYIDNFHALNDILKLNKILRRHVGVEVGVRHAITSHYLLSENPFLVLHLVDPYAPYNDLGYEFTEAEQLKILTAARERVSCFGDRARFILETSVKASTHFEDESVDFVFIDAVHELEHVTADIHAWFLKVRDGGFLCGHDYHMKGVKPVVDSFSFEHSRELHTTGMPADIWVIKK